MKVGELLGVMAENNAIIAEDAGKGPELETMEAIFEIEGQQCTCRMNTFRANKHRAKMCTQRRQSLR